jgi:hypothetical protein
MLWQRECLEEWTIISPNKKRTDKALNALLMNPPRSAFALRRNHKQVKKQLSFAAFMAYPACQGYEYPASRDEDNDMIQAGYDCSQIRRRAVSLPEEIVNLAAHSPPVSFGSLQQPAQVETHHHDWPESSVAAEARQGSNSLPLFHEEATESASFDDSELTGLEEVVADIAYRFWECGHCLSMGHVKEACMREVRCRSCFNYGHIEKDCLIKLAKSSKQWRPKPLGSRQDPLGSRNGPDQSAAPVTRTDSPPTSISPSPCQPPPSSSYPTAPCRSSTTMANFELDPTRWLPQGHQIIDGGPNRLPRTFYNPSVMPPRRNDHICTAILMPPPPQAQEQFWRNQVRNFIVQQLHRAVDDVQPCLFGLGFFRLRSSAARAALVHHDPYELQGGVFVNFVNHDDRDNHRAVQGFRTGWLMFLGVPFDFRNDYDIANAVASFGKFHHWHKDDEILERTLVYASFPSPALVPRDVVFGNFAIPGGIKESWTAARYVLTADFADIVPADEDQMPLDGNPRPMPGHMVPNDHDFVVPQFPELGWNEIPMQEQQFFHPEEQIQPEQQLEEQLPEVQPEVHQEQGSIVLNESDSDDSVNDLQYQQNIV